MEFLQVLVLMRPLCCLFVKGYHIHEHLGVRLPVLLGDSALVDQALPFLGEALVAAAADERKQRLA